MPATRVFGVTTASQSFCVLNTASKGTTAEKAKCRSELGVVTDEQAYSRNTIVKGSGLFIAASSVPKAGEAVTVGGVSYLLDSVTQTEKNTEHQTVEFEASKADAATQVALA